MVCGISTEKFSGTILSEVVVVEDGGGVFSFFLQLVTELATRAIVKMLLTIIFFVFTYGH